MKAAVPILVTVLVVGILNLLQGFGLFGGGSGSDEGPHQYIVYAAEDIPPFVTFLATVEFKDKADEEGNVTFPQAELFDIRKSLPRLLNFMSKEGWELAEIKEATGVHVFRRPLSDGIKAAPRPWEDGPAVPAPAGAGAGASDSAAPKPADEGAGAAPAAGGSGDAAAPAPAPAPAPAAGDSGDAAAPAPAGGDN